MGVLDSLIYGIRDVFDSLGNALPRRSRIQFTGTVTDDPANDRLIVEAGGSTPGGSVEELQAHGPGNTLKSIGTPAGVGSSAVFVDGEYIPGHPTPKGRYDPMHYGAMFDEQTDDYPAWMAMLRAMPDEGGAVHVPDGFSWVSRTIIFPKQVRLDGPGTYTGGIKVAPGKIGLQLDRSTVADKFIVTAASNASPIVVTVEDPHTYETGDSVIIANVSGNTAANGTWTVTKISDTTFSLNGSTGNGAFSAAQFTITNATAATPIVVTTSTSHGYSTGHLVEVWGVLGNDAANGQWAITVLSGTTFSLDGSGFGAAAYTSGGKVRRPGTSKKNNSTTADYSRIGDIQIRSRVLMHPSAHGSTLGYALEVFSGSMLVRKGDCVVRAAGASPTRCFRASFSGNAAIQLSGASTPAWSDTLGTTVTANGITWTTESLPRVRVDNTAYVVGDRVYAKNDNRFLYECIEAGTSSSAAYGPFANGTDGVTAAGLTINSKVADGTVIWRARLACGVYVCAPICVLENLLIERFAGAAIHVQAGTGHDARLVSTAGTDANNVRISKVNTFFCGVGLAFAGSDVNGWRVESYNVLHMGSLHPSASPTFTYPYPDGGRGGHIFHDNSQGGGMVDSLYGQLSTGRSLLKNGSGRTVFNACFKEVDGAARFTAGFSWIVGGTIASGLDPASSGWVQILDQTFGEGIMERDDSGSRHIRVALSVRDGHGLLERRVTAGGTDAYRWHYGAGSGGPIANYWAEHWGASVPHSAYLLSTDASGIDPGVGWMIYPKGYFLGDPTAGATFTGDISALVNEALRGGYRLAGDTFSSGDTITLITSAGYRGAPWTTGVAAAAYTPWALPATMTEPTTNTGTSSGGEKVFRCTVEGARGGSEPNWATATVVNDTVTDGAVTWTLVGFTPSYATSLRRADRDLTTTATTANQVIGSVTLASAASGKSDVYRVFVSFIGGGNAGHVSGKVEGSFKISDAGVITRLGTDDTSTVKGDGGALDTSAFNLNISSATIQARVTPGSATSTKWRAIVQLEKLAGTTA